MDAHQITCVNKRDRANPHERITHIGGVASGQRWRLTLAEAIARMESGKWSFYVHREGLTVQVVVAISQYGHKYLKTQADGL